jgi:hypothetical protein
MTKKKASEFYSNIKFMYLESTCVSDGKRIEKIIEKSVRANYKKVISLIKKFEPQLYYDIALDYYNPWENCTYRSRNNKYIIITNSSIEYLFKIET